MKFGGTSVGSPAAMRRVIDIVKKSLAERPVVVVSAMTKVTDLLYRICDSAEKMDEAATKALLEELRAKHCDTAAELLGSDSEALSKCQAGISAICDRLARLVNAVCAIGELSDRSKAQIVSCGETLSSTIMAFAMNANGIKTNWIDAKSMIITDGSLLCGEPRKTDVCIRVPQIISAAYVGYDAVITQGFVASSAEGYTSVLGRGGSDYSASLIGKAVGAKRIEIWTDVDGVRTADPRRVPGSKCVKEISFEEAAEMAHFGAKVLHPLTIEPAIESGIPLYVLNSMNPEGEGTAILRDDCVAPGIKTISCKENILVINIFSPKMIHTTGFVEKVFKVFSRNTVSVDLISTSEANISVTVEPNERVAQVVAELREFADVQVDSDKSQVSVVGKDLVGQNGELKDMFAPLAGYRLSMISQGASHINVSFVVERSELNDVIVGMHNYLFS